MRAIALAVFACIALDVAAQSTARPRPPGTTALEEPPPMPANVATDPALEAQIAIRTNDAGETVQEYRVKGKLYMQRVTPKHGRPYVLMDHKGDGTFTKLDNTLDSGVRVPQWVLLEF
jgi:hypothetical protein